jgi:hypothetical protein
MNQEQFEQAILAYVEIEIDPITGFKSFKLKPRTTRIVNIDLRNPNAKYKEGLRVRTPLGEFKSMTAASRAHSVNWFSLNKMCLRREPGYEIITGDKNEESKV